ncbi:MAG TPA: AAA family ATPase [Gaiellales bacterium]|nr:AAA family ATPase [Gaiellales bacterium]
MASRRVTSILFGDLVGFTTLSESRDTEDVRELLGRYFDECRRIVERYGGTIEKFIGDAVMAVWGTPVAQEDDAERAVRTALDLVADVQALGEELGLSGLRARAGVLTGEAAVTLGAAGQGMVAGDLVNTASRIQTAAEPGTVLVGEITKRSTEAALVYADAGPHELKGKAEPVPLWRAVRVVGAVGGAQRAGGLEAPFVGRGRELQMIKELFHATAEQGRAQLVSVIGGAGIGKSRMVWELFKYIDGLADPIRWHRGRCLAYGDGVTYWALAEMVRTRCNIVEGEDPAVAYEKLRSAAADAIPDAEERRWIEPRLAHLLGLEGAGPRDRDDLFAAWRRFYELLADEMPTVLVFEDLHWADEALVDFIEYLLEWSRSHRLLVLTLARPDIMERRPQWGVGRSATSIRLDPLPQDAMADMLNALIPGLPEGLEQKVLERADGVPLYAMETVRMLLDRGLIVEEEGSYRTLGEIETLEVPETLQALIAARLDGLTADERRLVQDAAVLGKTFAREALAAVSGLSIDELEPLLASLRRKEVLTVQADPLSPERGQYGFLGDLTRFVAYETLARRERRTRHLAVAEYLESIDDLESIEVVASHYVQAFEAAPDAEDAPLIRSRAVATLRSAGGRATSLGAHLEATRYYQQAIGLIGDDPAAAALYEEAGRAAFSSSDPRRADELFRRAHALSEAADDPQGAARVAALMAEVDYQTRGQSQDAIARMEQAFTVLTSDGAEETADVALLAAELGRRTFFTGRPDDGYRYIEFALTLAERLDLPEVFSEALDTKALLLGIGGRPAESTLLLRHSLEVALANDLGRAALRASNNLVTVAGLRSRHHEEEEAASAGLAMARRLGDRLWETKLLSSRLQPLTELGRWDEALATLAEVDSLGPVAETVSIVSEMTPLFVIYTARGDLPAARSVLRRWDALPEEVDVYDRMSRSLAAARLAAAEGDHARALTLGHEVAGMAAEFGFGDSSPGDGYLTAVEAAFQLGDLDAVQRMTDEVGSALINSRPTLRAETQRFRARLDCAAGDIRSAERRFLDAVEQLREIQTVFRVGVGLFELAALRVGDGRPDEAASDLDEAREIFTGLRARPWLERVEQAASQAAVA